LHSASGSLPRGKGVGCAKPTHPAEDKKTLRKTKNQGGGKRHSYCAGVWRGGGRLQNDEKVIEREYYETLPTGNWEGNRKTVVTRGYPENRGPPYEKGGSQGRFGVAKPQYRTQEDIQGKQEKKFQERRRYM